MSTTGTNRSCTLASRPVGMSKAENFSSGDAAIEAPGDGQFRVKISHISIDPAMRGWITDGPSYIPPVQIGEVMRAGAIGVIEASNNPKFPEGAAVTGMFGVQQYAISDGATCNLVDLSLAPAERWLGGLGMPGMTAYFGTMDILKPKEGETMVVSAASGAVGALVGQIGRLHGARVVGIAGGPEKCAYVVDELGFDACIDYKNDDVNAGLKEHAPKRVDMYFESVGGDIGNTVFGHMNTFGRVAVCGLIAGYNATSPEGLGYNPLAQRSMLVNRLKVQGFIVFDFASRYGEGAKAMVGWMAEGKLKMKEDVRGGGVDAFPDVLNELYTGGNFGKLVLAV